MCLIGIFRSEPKSSIQPQIPNIVTCCSPRTRGITISYCFKKKKDWKNLAEVARTDRRQKRRGLLGPLVEDRPEVRQVRQSKPTSVSEMPLGCALRLTQPRENSPTASWEQETRPPPWTRSSEASLKFKWMYMKYKNTRLKKRKNVILDILFFILYITSDFLTAVIVPVSSYRIAF